MEEEIIAFGEPYLVTYTIKCDRYTNEEEVVIEIVNHEKVNEVSIDSVILNELESKIIKFEKEKAEDSALGL